MLDRSFRLALGAYFITLPESAEISVSISRPYAGTHGIAYTHWVAQIGRYRLGIYLDASNDLSQLKEFIDSSTKSDITVTTVTVNGIHGVGYGDYASPVTRIDRWFKKGETMLCLDLQETDYFAKQPPSPEERDEHLAIIGSITHCADHVQPSLEA
jgi:hypothetical protein